MPQNKIIIISGPGGVGKTTTSTYLCEKFPNRFRESVSCTTRPIRKGEINHVHYHFLSDQEFQEKIESGEFVEFNKFPNGYMYGTLFSEISDTLKSKNCIMIIDPKTAMFLKQTQFFEANKTITIFLDYEEEVIMERLKNRGASLEEIWQRVEIAREERKFAKDFDFIVQARDLYSQSKEICQIAGENC